MLPSLSFLVRHTSSRRLGKGECDCRGVSISRLGTDIYVKLPLVGHWMPVDVIAEQQDGVVAGDQVVLEDRTAASYQYSRLSGG